MKLSKMKIVDMSRRDSRFWSLNIALSFLLCMAVYAVGHSEALAGALYGQQLVSGKRDLFSAVCSRGCGFALAWTLVFTVGYLFRGSWESLKKGFLIAAAAVILVECIKMLAFLPFASFCSSVFTGLLSCLAGGIIILIHERVLM